ncbi:MAG: peptidylprolyl isomerase [Caulobacteraceae bacterium]|nr:MAG: peptidylprolyl isomerase [Caulobacteraceae bacterium]
MRRLIVLTVAAAMALATSAAAAPRPKAGDWRTPDPRNVLVIDTNKGRVIVELVPEVAPDHVARLTDLAHKGTYDGRTFFRVIDRFMAQTGDPLNTGEGSVEGLANLKAEFTYRRAADSAFVPVAAPQGTQVGFLLSLPVVSQEISYTAMTGDKKVAAWGTYCPGVVGMARDENPDSANSQFFLMRYAYPSLDKRYTAFGRVVSGLDVIRAIKVGEPVAAPQDVMQTVRVLADIPEAQRPTVKIIDPKGPWFAAEVKRVRKQKGADFSVCDVSLPVEVQ